jgi:regulatory protein
MEIKWVPKEGRRNILTLIVDEDPFKDIHTTIFGRKPKITPCKSLEDLENLLLSLEYKGAKIYALKRLSLKNQPSIEMEKALKERLVSQKNRDKIIDELRSLGYLNDNEWIEGFIRNQTNKKIGPKAIYQKLKAKGLPDESIEHFLENYVSPEKQQTQIQLLLQTRYKSRNLNDYHQKQKVIASLLRKGFDFEQVREVLERKFSN